MKLFIATPCFNAQTTSAFAGSLAHTFLYLANRQLVEGITWFRLDNSSFISKARDYCAHKFLESGFDKLMFIDADISWHPEQLAQIIAYDKPIVGGTYPVKTEPIRLNYNCFRGDIETIRNKATHKLDQYEFLQAIRATYNSDIVPVKHLPTGFLSIKREVFQKLSPQVPSYSYELSHNHPTVDIKQFFPGGHIQDGRVESEDWAFCRIAQENGFMVEFDTNIIVKHHGNKVYSI